MQHQLPSQSMGFHRIATIGLTGGKQELRVVESNCLIHADTSCSLQLPAWCYQPEVHTVYVVRYPLANQSKPAVLPCCAESNWSTLNSDLAMSSKICDADDCCANLNCLPGLVGFSTKFRLTRLDCARQHLAMQSHSNIASSPAPSLSGSSEADRLVRLRDRAVIASTPDGVEAVLAQLLLLPREDLRAVLMQGPALFRPIRALETWRPALQAASGLVYVEVLWRLKLTAEELSKTSLLRTMQSLTEVAATAEIGAAALQLLRHRHSLIRASRPVNLSQNTGSARCCLSPGCFNVLLSVFLPCSAGFCRTSCCNITSCKQLSLKEMSAFSCKQSRFLSCAFHLGDKRTIVQGPQRSCLCVNMFSQTVPSSKLRRRPRLLHLRVTPLM